MVNRFTDPPVPLPTADVQSKGTHLKHCKGLWYCTHGDQADSSVHKWKSFINTTYSQLWLLFVSHTNKKQYKDTLHIQMKREINAQSDASQWLWYAPQKYPLICQTIQIPKIHKIFPKLSATCTKRVELIRKSERPTRVVQIICNFFEYLYRFLGFVVWQISGHFWGV